VTTRVKGCWVAFEADLREDDAAPLLAAIRQLRGVLAVELEPQTPSDWIAAQRVRHELLSKLWAVLNPTDPPRKTQ
jgi:hypothetical protein